MRQSPMSMREPNPVDRRPEDSPVAWFAVLETARRAGDFDRAAEAIRELRRLGICVSYRRPPRTREEVAHA